MTTIIDFGSDPSFGSLGRGEVPLAAAERWANGLSVWRGRHEPRTLPLRSGRGTNVAAAWYALPGTALTSHLWPGWPFASW